MLIKTITTINTWRVVLIRVLNLLKHKHISIKATKKKRRKI